MSELEEFSELITKHMTELVQLYKKHQTEYIEYRISQIIHRLSKIEQKLNSKNV